MLFIPHDTALPKAMEVESFNSPIPPPSLWCPVNLESNLSPRYPAYPYNMSRSVSVSAVPRRVMSPLVKNPRNSSLEDTSTPTESSPPPPLLPTTPREYDSCPCDSFFLLPDSVLSMDADTFRADLTALDPVLSASLPDWGRLSDISGRSKSPSYSSSPVSFSRRKNSARSPLRNPSALLHNHQGLTLTTAGRGTVLIGKTRCSLLG